MNKLEYMAARLAFGSVAAEEIWLTVDALLAGGTYSDEFIAIIDTRPPTHAESCHPSWHISNKRGLRCPTEIRRSGRSPAITFHRSFLVRFGLLTDLRLIADVYWDYDFHSPTKKFLGDSHGIEHLIALYWGYDDMKARPADVSCNGKHGEEGIQEVEKEILKRSEDWLKEFASKSLERSR